MASAVRPTPGELAPYEERLRPTCVVRSPVASYSLATLKELAASYDVGLATAHRAIGAPRTNGLRPGQPGSTSNSCQADDGDGDERLKLRHLPFVINAVHLALESTDKTALDSASCPLRLLLPAGNFANRSMNQLRQGYHRFSEQILDGSGGGAGVNRYQQSP